MDPKTKYKTRQRECLITYLRTIPGRHFTAADICDYFRSQGEPIGQSTVYRQLEQLVDEGILNKYNLSPGDPACFEFMEEDSHCGEEICFHCKCERCGRLIHLHCDDLVDIQAHLLNEHHFTLDPYRTVFYGICEACRTNRENEITGTD